MAIVNFKLKSAPQQYKPLNCQAVAQMIRDFNKSAAEKPDRLESSLDVLELVHRIGQFHPLEYATQFGTEWQEESKWAIERILAQYGRIEK